MIYVLIVLMLCIVVAQAYIIKKISQRGIIVHKVIDKPSEEEKQKRKKMREHFVNLMDYDYEKALKKE